MDSRHRHARCAYPGISGDHRAKRSFKKCRECVFSLEFQFNLVVEIFVELESAINLWLANLNLLYRVE